MDAQVIDRIKQEMESYEAAVPGAKGGEDYPMFAAVLAGHEHMRLMLKLGMMHMMFWMVTSPGLKMDPDTMDRGEISETVDKILRDAPIRPLLIEAAYLGYRIGKSEAGK